MPVKPPAGFTQQESQVTPPAGFTDAVPRGTPPPPDPTFMQQVGEVAKDVGKGIIKGGLNTTSTLGGLIHKTGEAIHPGLGEAIVPQSGLDGENAYKQTHNTSQKIGYAGEQAGELMVPGLGEEAAAEHAGVLAAEHAGQIAKFAKPIAKLGYQGLTSGLMNKSQGGNFGTGAASGVAGGLIGMGVKAAAPAITEFAQGIHTPGQKAGKAILNETSGLIPSSIRKSASGVLSELNPQLDAAAERAGTRPPAKIAGLLQAPERDIPLHSSPDVAGTPSRVTNFHQPDRVAPLGLPAPTHELPMTSHAGFPEQMPSGSTNISTIGSSPAEGMGHGEFTGQIPGERGGPGEVQGVLRTRASQGELIPPGKEVPYGGISLDSARTVAQQQVDKALSQGEPKMFKGVSRLSKQLNFDPQGNPVPDMISPKQYLDMKRGVGKALPAGSWNPDSTNAFKPARDAVYGAMNKEFERAVPEAAPLNRRISALIPATKEGKSAFGHAAGPAVGALIGGGEGYREGGIGGAVKGALIGGTAGTVAPALLNAGARTAYSPAAQKLLIPALKGVALQSDRN